MKNNKFFLIIVCYVSILILVTGCGKERVNNGKVADDNKIINCVREESIPVSKKDKTKGEYTKTVINEIAYDKNLNIIYANYEETVKYDDDNSKKISELKKTYEEDLKEYEIDDGITSSIETNDTNFISNIVKYDYMKVLSKNIKKTRYKKYINSNYKFDVESFKSDYEEQDYKCNIIG